MEEEIDIETYEEEPSSLFEEISATEQPLSSDGEEAVNGNEIKLTEEEQQNLREQGLLYDSQTEDHELTESKQETDNSERDYIVSVSNEIVKEDKAKAVSPRAVLKETTGHQDTYKPVGIYGSPNVTHVLECSIPYRISFNELRSPPQKPLTQINKHLHITTPSLREATYDSAKDSNNIKVEALFEQLNRTNEELRRKTDKLGHLKMTLSLLQKSEIQQLSDRIDKANSEIAILKERTIKIDQNIELHNNTSKTLWSLNNSGISPNRAPSFDFLSRIADIETETKQMLTNLELSLKTRIHTRIE